MANDHPDMKYTRFIWQKDKWISIF